MDSLKRSAYRRFAACVLLSLMQGAGPAGQSLPGLTKPVNDFAQVIDATHAARLDRMIRSLQQATGDVLVVATVKTIAPHGDIREYAVKLFENHGKGIGQRGKDNGALILVAVAERRVWVEVGYDLEQFVTDGFAGETSRQYMVPAFRTGDYGAGLEAGTARVIQRIASGRGVTIPDLPTTPARRQPEVINVSVGVGLFILLIIILLVIAASVSSSRNVRRRRRWGGDTWSGWNSGVGPFGGGGGFGGGGFGGGFGGFGGGRSGGGGGGASW